MANIVVPQLGESVVEARVARWLKKPGDRVETGQPVVELETDKIDLEVGAEQGGVISRIERNEGETVKVGEVLAVVDDTGAAFPASAVDQPPATSATPPTPAAVAAPAPTSMPPVAASPAPEPEPSAERAPTLPSRAGEAASPPPANPVTSGGSAQAAPVAAAVGRIEERIRMSLRRQTIARRLVEAQRTAAMLTTFNEVDMTAVMDLRTRAKDRFKAQHGVGLGIASFFVTACIAALRTFPRLNAEIQGDEIVLKRYYDIGVAVDSEGGLVVPVLRDADRMSFAEIEAGIRAFAARAADGTLTLEDLRGGTFTVTNGGIFGSLFSTPILNPPQVGILGLHKIQDRAVAVNGQVAVRPMMFVALSYDHRLVDGREAVQFLAAIKEYVEDPGRLLLDRR